MIHLLTPPIFDDEERTLAAHHLFFTIWTFMAVACLVILIGVILPETLSRWLWIAGIAESVGLIQLALNRRGYTRLVGYSVILTIWAMATGLALTGGGIGSNAMPLYLIGVLIIGTVLSGKAGIISAILFSLTGLILVYLEGSSLLPTSRVPHTPLTQWIAMTIYMAIIVSLQYMISRTIRKSFQQKRQDLQERQQVTEALRESEELYTKLIATLPDIIVRMNLRGEILFINNIGVTLSGYGWTELIGQNMFSLIAPEDQERALRNAALMFEGTLGPQEYHLIMKDGRKLLFEANGDLLRDAEDSPYGMVLVCRDITGRRQAEEALRESEEKFRLLIEDAPEAIFVHAGYRFIYLNRAAVNLFGVETAGQLVGSPIMDRFHPDYHETIDKRLDVLYRKREKTAIDGQVYLRLDGSPIPVEAHAVPISYNDRNAALTFVHDITKRKQAEEAKERLEERLRQADKMEAIGTLAGGIAHDFNNLLMGIQGYASLTMQELDPSHPHYERLKRIEEQVKSGADLTRQLLGFAQGGRYEVKPADLNEILEKNSSMFGRTKKEISIYRRYADDLWSVEVDRGQMEQVFMNLYVNAWQAMPGGGTIYLETENVLLDDARALSYAVPAGRYVKISVTDTGTGIDEKTRERIFDPFFTTKGMGRGTGLGLATVYGIIKGHKGAIQVYSEPGHGTTFNLYLPASGKEVIGQKAETGAIATGTGTILLVDDEPMVLEVSREMLESLGYRVHAVGSGQEALAVYMEKQKEIDLVLLDMIMPGISGGETFDRLRKLEPGVKVLLSSGYSINGEAQLILDRGCNGFIQKPFQLEKLSVKIREILPGENPETALTSAPR